MDNEQEMYAAAAMVRNARIQKAEDDYRAAVEKARQRREDAIAAATEKWTSDESRIFNKFHPAKHG